MRTSAVAAATLLLATTLSSYAGAAPATGPSTKGMVVWTNRAADGSESLLIADADGSHRRRLTHAPKDVGDIDAQFSPNGAWVAYERDTADGPSVRLVRPDGSDDHALAVPCADPCVGSGAPTWMSDRRLAVVLLVGPFDPDTDNAAQALLWTVRLDGSGLRRLSAAGAAGVYEDSYAHVSRDLSFVTFMRRRLTDGVTSLFRADADGRHPQRLLPWGLGVEVNDLSTAASGPTKDLLLFEAYGRGDPDATFVDLGTVPALCASLKACHAKLRWLTDNAASGRRNANPHWSPTGRDLVFTDRANIDTEDVEIWTSRYWSGERRRISASTRFDYRPDWGRG